MFYCYTDDLLDVTHYTQPQLLLAPASGHDAIDGDIIYDAAHQTYYLYYKDEDEKTICYVTSKHLAGPYSTTPTRAVNTEIGLEGCNAHFITGTDTLVMLADAYGDGYFVLSQATDFKNFYLMDDTDYTINNCSPRHGSVVAISDDEYQTLIDYYGLS